MTGPSKKTVALIVAHPDDETLWAGGMILSHPSWNWFALSLCRGSDMDRSSRFYKALKILKSDGIMGDMDDGPEQNKLDEKVIEKTILDLLPPKHFDLIITHDPSGEYTRHLRHEEVSRAVINLWKSGKVSTNDLWTFAYEDNNKAYFPKAEEEGTFFRALLNRIWLRKYAIITETYGFEKSSWEAQTTPKIESFRQFTDPLDAHKWLKICEKKQLEDFKLLKI
jgi:LmbE family N-acetylglucosaminyl deacetylase